MRLRPLLFRGALAAMVLAELVLVWRHPFFPSQDGPVHLEMSWLAERLASGEAGILGRYFELDLRPVPNLAIYPMLILLRWLVPLWAVDKIVVSLYYVAWVLGLRALLRATASAAPELLVLGFALAPNFLLHMGFWNFSLGLPLAMLTAAFAWSRRGKMSPGAAFAVVLLLLVTALFHLVALGMALLLLGCFHLAEALCAEAPARLRWRDAARRARDMTLLALPALLLTLPFFRREAGSPQHWRPWTKSLEALVHGDSLVSFNRREIFASGLIAEALTLAVILAVAGRSRSEREPGLYGWLGVTGALAAAYFLFPSGLAGGGYLSQRLLLCLLVAAVGVAAASRPSQALGLALGVTALVAWAGQYRLHWERYGQINRVLAEFVAVAPKLPAGATLLALAPVRFLDGDLRLLSYRVRPFQHAGCYLTMSRGMVNLASYQAHQTYFPVRYRPDMDPYVHLSETDRIEEDPLAFDFARFNRGPRRCDLIYLFAKGTTARRVPGLFRDYETLGRGARPHPWRLYHLRAGSVAGEIPAKGSGQRRGDRGVAPRVPVPVDGEAQPRGVLPRQKGVEAPAVEPRRGEAPA